MRRYAVFAAIIAVCVLLGVGLNSIDSSKTRDSTDIGGFKGVSVIDCRNQSFRCGSSTIEFRRTSCEPWQTWTPYSKLNCNRTTEGLEDVSLVTDPANYIPVEMTDASYTVKALEETGEEPWDLAFLPSGEKLWTRKNGTLMHETGNGVSEYRIDSILVGEAGLMGVAVDPQYEQNNYIYLHYAYRKTNRTATYNSNTILENRISRFRLTEDGPENETVIKTVPGSKWHSGGRLEFGPDGKLYATTGDADNPFKAAYNESYLGGSILRMNRDGSVPDDNPFNDSVVYSMGHRNPQGIAWNPETGALYNSEHGPWRHDEINRVMPGANYGWGEYRCGDKTDLPGGRDGSLNNTLPVKCFEQWTIAPSGMTFVDDPGHPWYGDLFVAGLRGKQVYRVDIENGEVVDQEVFYVPKERKSISLRLRHVDYHNGSLYVLGDIKGMVRITPS